MFSNQWPLSNLTWAILTAFLIIVFNSWICLDTSIIFIVFDIYIFNVFFSFNKDIFSVRTFALDKYNLLLFLFTIFTLKVILGVLVSNCSQGRLMLTLYRKIGVQNVLLVLILLSLSRSARKTDLLRLSNLSCGKISETSILVEVFYKTRRFWIINPTSLRQLRQAKYF